LIKLGNLATYLALTIFVISILMNIFFTVGTSMAWNLLSHVQYIIHYPLLMISCPSNATFFFKVIANIANFKVIPT